MSDDPALLHLWLRLETDDLTITADDLRILCLPPSLLEPLIKLGLFRQIENSWFVGCDSCDAGHSERVLGFENKLTGALEFQHWCPECGVVHVAPWRLRQWEVHLAAVAELLAQSLSLAGRIEELIPRRLWLLGRSTLGSRLREVFLLRGATWRDRDPVLALSQRFVRALDPVVLVGGLPEPYNWPADGPPWFSLHSLTRREGETVAVDRAWIDDTLGARPRELSPVGLLPVATPAGARWREVYLVVDDHSLQYEVLGHKGRRTFQEAGFENRVKGKYPDQLWELLRLFAQGGGILLPHALTPKLRRNLKQYVSELRKRLQALFQLEGNPIASLPDGGYQTLLSIRAQDGIALPMPAETRWSQVTVTATNAGTICFAVETTERFSYSEGEDREMAERATNVSFERDLRLLGLLAGDGEPNALGETLLGLLVARGRVKRSGHDHPTREHSEIAAKADDCFLRRAGPASHSAQRRRRRGDREAARDCHGWWAGYLHAVHASGVAGRVSGA